ncbi:MAG: B12-binding domain-containing radical SAM protein [Candidatus Scalinduaceae bacterium]
MARITFIYFDLNTGYYPSFHHGLASLIGTLKIENHKVYLHHLIFEDDFDKAIKFLEEEKLDVVGLSFTTNQKKHVRRFLEIADLSEMLTVAGGVHCTLVKEEVFKDFPEIDGICLGEGEAPLRELCRRLDNGDDYLATPSFCFRTNDGIGKNAVVPLQGVEVLPLPDYTLFDYDKIISDNGQCFPMMLSRGCPYNCHYCCNHAFREIYPNKGDYVRFPSIERSINVIKNNLSLYPGTKKIIFADDTFTLNKKWLSGFCEVYKKEIDLPFLCNARVETMGEQVAKDLKHGGCISIDFGVESGNEWLRRNILNRRHSNRKIKDAFEITKKYGIKSFSFNIVGLPFETTEMAKDTLNLNMELQPDFGKCFYFYPYPKSRIHQLCLDYGLLLDDLESVSGYLEAPSLKEVFMSHKEMKKYFELMQSFFYARLLFSKIRMPLFLEKLLLKIIFLLRKPILAVLDTKSDTLGLRRLLRKFAMKYLRGNA